MTTNLVCLHSQCKLISIWQSDFATTYIRLFQSIDIYLNFCPIYLEHLVDSVVKSFSVLLYFLLTSLNFSTCKYFARWQDHFSIGLRLPVLDINRQDKQGGGGGWPGGQGTNLSGTLSYLCESPVSICDLSNLSHWNSITEIDCPRINHHVTRVCVACVWISICLDIDNDRIGLELWSELSESWVATHWILASRKFNKPPARSYFCARFSIFWFNPERKHKFFYCRVKFYLIQAVCMSIFHQFCSIFHVFLRFYVLTVP